MKLQYSAIFLVLLMHYTNADNWPKNGIYLELFGQSFPSYCSVNYYRSIFQKANNHTIGLQSGFGYSSKYRSLGSIEMDTTGFPGKPERVYSQCFSMPVSVQYLFGRDTHFLEMGIGYTPALNTYSDMLTLYHISYVILGYRYHPAKRGIMYRISFTPGSMFKMHGAKKDQNDDWMYDVFSGAPLFPMGGVSVGYAF